MTDLTGKNIGHYHNLQPLGRGGMATVFKARDEHLEREIAIKFISMDMYGPSMQEHLLKRFEREAKALARLSHPNIIKVYEYGEYEDVPYLVMEYLPGGTLKERIGGPMTWQTALDFILPLAKALGYAHQQGIVHRDVKPANVLLNTKGEPILSDFGIAQVFMENKESTLTTPGIGIGSPEYMAPEQWTGETSPSVDMYALGVFFYEMVTGKKPYTAEAVAGIYAKLMYESTPRPRDLNANLPEVVQGVIMKMMAKEPAQRYASMQELVGVLTDLPEKVKQAPQDVASNLEDMPTTIVSIPSATAQSPQRKLTQTSSQVTPTQTAIAPITTSPKSAAFSALAKPGRRPGWFWAAGVVVVLLVVGTGILLLGNLTGGLARMEQKGVETVTMTPTVQDTATSQPPSPTATRPSSATPVLPTDTPTLTPTMTLSPTTFTSTPSLTPTLGIGSTRVSSVDNMVLVYVPEGNFLMGASEEQIKADLERCILAGTTRSVCESRGTDQKPQHTVWLDTYWIDMYEVTNGQYQSCVTGGACQPPLHEASNTRISYYGNPVFDNYPVIYVDWNQAKTYCEWAGRQLPSEAQWEKAARGTDGRIYPWGNENAAGDLLNFADVNSGYEMSDKNVNDGFADTSPIGNYPRGASPYGVMDMEGNVSEWLNDLYQWDYYKKSPDKNPTGASSGYNHVVRGSAWYSTIWVLGVYSRGGAGPADKSPATGFRCAANP
jgi:eukaryotic-like serine/threonine-protein kinase